MKAAVQWAIEQAKKNKNEDEKIKVIISIDDSKVKKDKKSRHFEPVGKDFDYQALGRAYFYGLVFVTVHLWIEGYEFTVNFRLYLRHEKVGKLNKGREKGDKIKFKSKYRLAMKMLFS